MRLLFGSLVLIFSLVCEGSGGKPGKGARVREKRRPRVWVDLLKEPKISAPPDVTPPTDDEEIEKMMADLEWIMTNKKSTTVYGKRKDKK